jgi:hypothetical protein
MSRDPRRRVLVDHFRRLDRRHFDRYQESVVDLESGVEIHHCDEPLSKHWGHGSAKRPN